MNLIFLSCIGYFIPFGKGDSLFLFDAHGGGLEFWIGLVVLFVVYLFVKFLSPFLKQMMKERESTIEEEIESAATRRKKAAQEIESLKESLNNVEEEVAAIISEGKKDAQVLMEGKKGDVVKEIEKIRFRQKREIELYKGAALHEVKIMVINETIQKVKGQIENKLGSREHKSLIRECIDQYQMTS